MRISVIVFLVAMFVAGVLRHPFSFSVLCRSLSASTFLLVLYPLSYERESKSAVHILLFGIAFCVFSLNLPVDDTIVFPLMYAVGFSGYILSSNIRKYSDFKNLIRGRYLWFGIEDSSRMISFSFFLSNVMIQNFFHCIGALWLPFALDSLVSLALFLAFYTKAYTGRTYLFNRRMEERLQSVNLGDAAGVALLASGDGERLLEIFRRIQKYMEDNRPYLRDDFSLNELASAVYVNRVYASKAINIYADKNFCQYINGYRINYSIEVMKRNRKIKMSELAVISGFHSQVTFTMAFKQIMEEPPSQYIRHLCFQECPSTLTEAVRRV